MPDLKHLWQRFLLAAALVAGLAIGVGATVFGYSNLNTVDLRWSVLTITGVPLWAVVIVPIALILLVGTVFHWLDGLHHFTEHMRHRSRVHELEAEVSRLRAHLDQVLQMPRGEAVKAEDKPSLPATDLAATDAEMAALEAPAAIAAEPEPEPDDKTAKAAKGKRAKLLPEAGGKAALADNGVASEPEVAATAAASATDQDR